MPGFSHRRSWMDFGQGVRMLGEGLLTLDFWLVFLWFVDLLEFFLCWFICCL